MAQRKKPIKDYLFSGGQYTPQRDGSLQDYLKTHHGMSGTYNLFHGYIWFETLQKEGYLVPEMSIIRLMWNICRGDEHFLVTKDFQLEGIICDNFHGGRKGTHDPKKVLTEGPDWEAHYLNLEKIREK